MLGSYEDLKNGAISEKIWFNGQWINLSEGLKEITADYEGGIYKSGTFIKNTWDDDAFGELEELSYDFNFSEID